MVMRAKQGGEQLRLKEADEQTARWRFLGPYLSERQWGTVREDYSKDGNAWDYFSHDQARSRAYRWGEDGLAGISDERQRLCFALCLWNEKDPILKERAFGLTNSEGNHGEDVKEYYYYLDSTPTHSYMKYLYKYPQAEYPYNDIVSTNRQRSRQEPEYELVDTGIFNDSRYFDIFVEYAKESPEELLILITAENRGPDSAAIHILPTLWFRNTWSWGVKSDKPLLQYVPAPKGLSAVEARHNELGSFFLYCHDAPDILFTENETNNARIFGNSNFSPYVKDAFHGVLLDPSRSDLVNPKRVGTKCAPHYSINIPAHSCAKVKLRLSRRRPEEIEKDFPKGLFGTSFEATFAERKREADEFYRSVIPSSLSDDHARVMRQALAGMLWSKQYYHFDLDRWLEERGSAALRPKRVSSRNESWHHMYNADVISMPDKWEYPWYAAWDLAFHVLALTMVDTSFGKAQLSLMLNNRYLHPNGQIPAYEWNFGDVNPPVHAWATYFTYQLEKARTGSGDIEWLKQSFDRLLMNFTWWVNRKDREGRNVFEGGFLGLDNIGVFDRSSPLPTGGWLEQADGTAWMAMFSQNMFQMSVELSHYDSGYEEMVLKFAQHSLWIASAMFSLGSGDASMWDEEDGFFYDVLRLPDGSSSRIKVRSMVGLLPLGAVAVVEKNEISQLSDEILTRYRHFLEARPELLSEIHDPRRVGAQGRKMFALVNEERLKRILKVMLDENEFFGPYGLRSVSKIHAEHQYIKEVGEREYRVAYLPGESDTGMFGGNSNWRGPVWMPVNVLIVRSLLNLYYFYGDDFRVECPTGSGKMMNLFEVAKELTNRLAAIFLRDGSGRRPVNGECQLFQNDPHWRDNILFYEYFHGDSGRGVGAGHQTGWTGVIARLMQIFGAVDATTFLNAGRAASFESLSRVRPEEAGVTPP